MIKPELTKKFEDLRLNKLHDLIRSLYDTTFFKSKFKWTILELNSLLERKVIGQEIYDDCIHTINSLTTIYFREVQNPETLLYFCRGCSKYFLEKNGDYLKEEIKTGHELKYGKEGICSPDCCELLTPKLCFGISFLLL